MQFISWVFTFTAAFLAGLVVVIRLHTGIRLGRLRWPFGLAVVATVGSRVFLSGAPEVITVLALVSSALSIAVSVRDMRVTGSLLGERHSEP